MGQILLLRRAAGCCCRRLFRCVTVTPGLSAARCRLPVWRGSLLRLCSFGLAGWGLNFSLENRRFFRLTLRPDFGYEPVFLVVNQPSCSDDNHRYDKGHNRFALQPDPEKTAPYRFLCINYRRPGLQIVRWRCGLVNSFQRF
jgi:hypothetical protein